MTASAPQSSRPSRRKVLTAALAGAATIAGTPLLAQAHDRLTRSLAAGGSFPEGVSSGVPRTSGAILWTRLAEVDTKTPMSLLVSRKPDLSSPVLATTVTADPTNDGCVHVPFAGGVPGEEYYYRFNTGDVASPVGRFRTLRPADSAEPVRIGFFTCQAFTGGYYAAHRHLAAEDLDMVVALGDYIYEGGGTGPGGRVDNIGFGELSQYRRKYELYRSDADLRNMHAAHSVVPIWDDHEYRNNWWREGYNGQLVPTAEFERQKQNALRAYFEHMPIPRFSGDPNRIYRSLRFGANAELFVLDTRSYRDAQPCGDGGFEVCPDVDEPGRKLLGRNQKKWLMNNIGRSKATWKVLGNQVMMMGMLVGEKGERAYLDTWDGYGAERTEVLSRIAKQTKDFVIVTGDDHDTFAGELWNTGFEENGTTRAGVEFVVPALSSGNTRSHTQEQNRLTRNGHLKLCDMFQHGYGVLELTASEAKFAFRQVDRSKPDAGVVSSYQYVVPKGTATLERV